MPPSTTANTKNQNVGGLTDALIVSPTITANSAYAVGDVLGTYGGSNSFIQDAFFRGSANSSGILESILVIDSDQQAAGLVFDFFSVPPGTKTDKVAYALSATEALNFLGRVSVAAGDYVTAGGVSVATVTSLNLPIRNGASDANLYLVVSVLTGSTPTYTATTGRLQFKFGVLQD